MMRPAILPRALLLAALASTLAGPLFADAPAPPLVSPHGRGRQAARAGEAPVDRGRLLGKDVYPRLSSGAQRFVRHAAGQETWARPEPARAASTSSTTAASAAPLAGPPAPLQNVRVNDPSLDQRGHTNSESSIAVRGSTVVVSFNDASVDVAGFATSTDGGGTFTQSRVPAPDQGYTLGDTGVAFGPSGEVYLSTLIATWGGYVSSVGVSKSTDGGRTFAPPVDVAESVTNELDVQDRPSLAVDANPGSKYAGNVYVAWTDYFYEGFTLIGFARSTDGGKSFLPPVGLSPADGVAVRNPSVAVSPDGVVYVAYEDLRSAPSSLTVVRSSDGGATWGSRVTVATFQPVELLTGGGGVRTSGAPSIVADGSKGVHVVWTAATAGTLVDRADVFYARSADSGQTFSAARKLNDDGTTTSQAFPALAMAPDGTLAVRWACRRHDPVNDSLTGVFVAISRDRGTSFGPSFRVTDTSWTYGPVEQGLAAGYHGAYDGITADGSSFYLSWSDERGSDPDVYFARVPVAADASAPDLDVAARQLYATVKAGGTAVVDLTTKAVNGFAGPIALSVSSPDPRVTATLSKASVAPGEGAQLLVAASPAARTADLTLVVTAQGGGLARATNVRLSSYGLDRAVPPPAFLTRTPGFTGSGGVKADAAGRLHLAYEDDTAAVRGEDVFYVRSTDGGATFSAPRKLNPSGTTAIDPVVAAGAGDVVVAFFTARESADGWPRLYAARSADGGATFSAAAPITPTDQYPVLPSTAMDAAGRVLVAWFDYSNGVGILIVSRSTDGGKTFDPISWVDRGYPAAVTRPAIAFDSKGAAYLAYTQQAYLGGATLSAVAMAVAPDGRSFGSPFGVSDVSVVDSFAPDLAVGPGDTLNVAYYNLYGSSSGAAEREVVFVRSTDGGQTFSAETSVSASAGQSRFPAVAVEPGGAVVVLWEETQGNPATDVFASRSTDGGATFTRPFNVSANVGYSGSEANPVDPPGGSGRIATTFLGGRLLVSWLDDSGGSPDVQVTAFDPALLSAAPLVVTITSPSGDTTVEAGQPLLFTGTGTSPDGAPVTLSWDFGDGTAASGSLPGPHPFALPGRYAVGLVGRDAKGNAAAASVVVTVTEPAATGASLLVPVVLEASGLGGSRYTTELTLASRSTGPSDVVLRYTGSKGGGGGVARLTLAAGEQRIVPGVVAWLRARNVPIPADPEGNAGTLLVTFGGVASASDVFAGARTFTADPSGGAGTFGLFYAAAAPVSGTAQVTGLQQGSAQRSNLGLVNAGPSPVTLRVSLLGASGEPLGTLPDQELGPYGWAQADQPLSGKAASGRAVVTRVGGDGPFTAYGVLNDAVTSDGSYLPALAGDGGSGASRLVPVVLDVAGVGARFRSELTLANLTAAPLPLSLAYTAATGFGSGSGSVALTLAAGEQRVIPDAIAFLRQSLPIEADGRDVAGSLLVSAPAGIAAGGLAAGARTFVPLVPAGSFGVYTPGLGLDECATTVAWVHGLQEGDAQRSNLALVNRGDARDAITLRVTLLSPSGAPLGAALERTLQPGEWLQLARPLAGSGVSAGTARVERVSGVSRFVAYGVLNDNVTSDGSVLPMSR